MTRPILFAFALIGLSATNAFAQGAPVLPLVEQGKRSFDPAFFAAYSPVTALDMVNRVPGFSIGGGQGRRGFGENAGNVLIDGERPSSKSDDIESILGRIPASQVERIELIEEAGGDGEARGRGQVINIVRRKGSAASGTYDIAIAKALTRGFSPIGNGSLTLRRGETSYELNAGLFDEKQRGKGPEDFFDGQRRLTERRVYDAKGRYTEATLGGSVKTKLGAAKLNLNGKAKWRDGDDLRLGDLRSPTGTLVGSEVLLTEAPDSDPAWEVGGDIEFALAPKLTTKLVGLYGTETESSEASIETARAAGTTRFDSATRNTASEAVLRLQNDWSGLSGHAIQFGAELAYNRLDSRFSSAGLSIAGVRSTSSTDVLVQETRLEPFVSDVWSIGSALKLESGAIFEFSKLRLTGDSAARRSFTFAKPRMIATWTAGKQTIVEFRAVHQVAQLNFDEFATSVDLGLGGQVDRGNQDLVPEKTTTFSAILRQKFLERGSIQLQTNYVLVRDTQDLVPVGIRDALGVTRFFDGAGNIGNSSRWDVELEITLPFDWLTRGLGVTGIELKYVGHYHGSRVTDPVTGLNRRVSFRPEWHQSWDIRHDLGKSGFAWGVKLAAAAPFDAYFVDQFRSQRNGIDVDGFIEYKKFKLGTIKFQVFDANGAPFYRDRFLFAGTRASGQIIQTIERVRKLDPQFRLSLAGKF